MEEQISGAVANAAQPVKGAAWVRVPYGQTPREQLIEFWRRRDLMGFMFSYGIGRLYSKAFLGMAWLFIRPAIMVGGAVLVVGHMLGVTTAPVPLTLFMLVSFPPWLLFQRGLASGTRSFSIYKALFDRFIFPRTIAQIASVGASCLIFALLFAFALVGMVYYAGTGIYVMSFGWHTLWVPVALAMLLVLIWGLGFFTAPLNAMAADTWFTIRYLLTFLMIATPVFFPLKQLSPEVQAYMWYNPLACIIELYRWGLFHQNEPSWWHIWLAWSLILALFMAGWWFFARCEQRALEGI